MAFTRVKPDVAGESQTKAASCWYSGFRMLFKWKGKDPDKILEMLDKSPKLFPYEMKDTWGIDASECREAARMLGLQASGDGELDAKAIADTLAKRGPIWIAGNWGRGNHVIVIVACDPDLGRLRVINPYQNFSGSDSPMTISELNNRGQLWKTCDASVMCW